jgi:aminoglycoside 3-N-acetyltransferase
MNSTATHPVGPSPTGRLDDRRLDGGRLVADLAALGLPANRDVLVHCSMRELGPVAGGPAALADALRTVIGTAATLVVPAQTPNNSTTSPVFQRAISGLDDAGRAAYIAALPGFDRDRTPSYGMGAFAEYVRRRPDSIRSAHPQTSFAAIGPRASAMLATHDLDSHLGERSPLGALYRADASVLLLGVGYEVCTAFHLAEYRHPLRSFREYQCFVIDNGRRRQCDFQAVHLNDHDFTQLGESFEIDCPARIGRVGNATARVLSLRRAADFALGWMGMHRCP